MNLHFSDRCTVFLIFVKSHLGHPNGLVFLMAIRMLNLTSPVSFFGSNTHPPILFEHPQLTVLSRQKQTDGERKPF